jgi:tRNA A37 N6-isopentenylltransferase MiaA
MEDDMKHALRNSIKENMHALLESTLVQYANLLRSKYPDKTIRNADVFTSGVNEFARLGYIELVDARIGIPNGLPAFLVQTIKRAKHQPIWIPGRNFPDEPWEIYDRMQPSMRGDEIIWRHCPSERRSTWRDRTGIS